MPDTPSVSASWANLMSVSVIASRAPETSSGCSRRSCGNRSPDSFFASDSGEKSVGTTGASPIRRSKPRRMIVSISSV